MISEGRMLFIRQKVEELKARLDIDQYPIRMEALFLHNYSDRYFLYYEEFNENADVVTNYYPEFGEGVIFINKKRVKPNLMKRLNFSLAHELGHLELNHYLLFNEPGIGKAEEKALEDEADEFAAQFLIPEDEVWFMPRKLKVISDYFFVSEDAVSVRLQNLDRQTLKKRPVNQASLKTFRDISKGKSGQR